jgi:hypothetical protein
LTYQVQFTSQLPNGTWTDLGASITAIGPVTSTTDAVGGNTTRYYRVRTP